MVIVDVWHVPIVLSLAVIATVLAVSIVVSLRATRPNPAPEDVNV
jgi:hypothetical protein